MSGGGSSGSHRAWCRNYQLRLFGLCFTGTITFSPGSKSLSEVKMCNLGQTPQVFLGSCMEAWWMKEMHWRCCAWRIVHKPWLISSAANELAKYLFGWDFHGNKRTVLYWETHLSLGVLENWHNVWYINIPVLHVLRKGIVDQHLRLQFEVI